MGCEGWGVRVRCVGWDVKDGMLRMGCVGWGVKNIEILPTSAIFI